MIAKIYRSAFASNPRSYNPMHHSMETRNSKELHQQCNLITPKGYSKITIEGTEEIFCALATLLNLTINNQIRAVFFRDLEETTQTTRNKSNVENKQADYSESIQFPQYPLIPSFPFYQFPAQFGIQVPQLVQMQYMPMHSSLMNSNKSTPLKSDISIQMSPENILFENNHPDHDQNLMMKEKEKECEEKFLKLEQQNDQLQNQIACLFTERKKENGNEKKTSNKARG